ncbi:MAG: amino acid ABC transporter permease [Aliivibrio sp.]|uniref:amino acid ABC transporter permease n=1 Tax=Aliivibrio sp. TaxID=1872443 RepID=UPI001A622DA6|nr:amino acid ABC transporter permease [Aliivibrio sp.]
MNKGLAFFKPALLALGQIIILFSSIVYIINSGAQVMGYSWQWDRVPDFILVYEDGEWWATELLSGLWVTMQISFFSLFATFLIGLITTLARVSSSISARLLSRLYIEIIRNTPLLVQIYILYFVLGPVIGLDRFTTAVLALALFQGAYTAEILRSGLNSIPTGQFEACRTLGLSSFSTYYYVILPQVIQRTLPPLTNEIVSLVKNSSIVSVMAIFDLTTEGRNIIADTAMPFEIWFTVAIIYLCLTVTISFFAAQLETKLGAHWR